jgi:flagellar hook-associated protein 3 FlgL
MIAATGNRLTREIARQSTMTQNIARSQISISTGRRFERASEDPVASVRVASLARAQADDATWRSNLSLGASLAAQADGVMKGVSDRLARAQELTVSGANGTLDAGNRAAIALELRGIADEIDSYGATKSSLGQPLFARGDAVAIRFSESSTFAPVPSRSAAFDGLSQTIRDAAIAIEAGNAAGTATSLTNIDAAIIRTADVAAEIGTHASRIDRLQDQLITRGIEFSAERSGLEDTDLSVAIAKLNGQLLTLEAAQGAFARINRRTLMDILG